MTVLFEDYVWQFKKIDWKLENVIFTLGDIFCMDHNTGNYSFLFTSIIFHFLLYG